jgi:DNA (cytosine-5)-methyltransferase 1
MLQILQEKLGYKVYYKVMNSMEYANVPQNRERIFIVGFDPDQVSACDSFEFPSPVKLKKTVRDVIFSEKQADEFYYKNTHQYYPALKAELKSRETVYQWRRVYIRENKSNVCPTLTANMGGGGHNVPLIVDDFGIRKLTPQECLLFQGFPKSFGFPASMANSHRYKQAGNSVVVPLVTKISKLVSDLI